MKERIWWIDWMKTLGMFFIILGHTCPDGWEAFIYAFSVPMFFMMSGILNRHEKDLRSGIDKWVRTLIVPYLLITAICALIEFYQHPFGIDILLIKCVYTVMGIQAFAGVTGCGTMWFVYTLVLLKLLHQIIGNKMQMHRLASIVFLGISAVLHNTIGKGFGCAITDVLLAYPFFCVGYELKHVLMNTKRVSPVKVAVGGGNLLILTLLSSLNGAAYMVWGLYGNYILLFVLNALLGSYGIYVFCKLMDKYHWKGINIISSGNILILGFHYPLLGLMGHLPMVENTLLVNIEKTVFSFILLCAFIPFIKLVKRYSPILLGNR